MIRATWKDTVSSTDLSLMRCFISLWSKKCLGYVLLYPWRIPWNADHCKSKVEKHK